MHKIARILALTPPDLPRQESAGNDVGITIWFSHSSDVPLEYDVMLEARRKDIALLQLRAGVSSCYSF
jgi:hypothetical protein